MYKLMERFTPLELREMKTILDKNILDIIELQVQNDKPEWLSFELEQQRKLRTKIQDFLSIKNK